MKLNIKELLDFFDDGRDSQKGDANALMSILGEDLNISAYRHFRNNEIEVLEDSVTQGFKGGKQLDRWVLDKKNELLFQCEIKNWASTAIGGKKLSSDASDEETSKIKEHYWKHQLTHDLSKETKHPSNVSKVLLPMRKPEKFKMLKTEALLIYWMPISSNNGLGPLSIISVESLDLPIKSEFSKLHIFSVSLYLRQLYKKGKGIKFIDLDMPHFGHRMEILGKFQGTNK